MTEIPDHQAPGEQYVWIWLPGSPTPILCGHLRWDGRAAAFAYVRSYRERAEAIALAPDWRLEEPLGERWFPAEDDALPGPIADVAPGRWGECVLEKIHGRRLNAFQALIAGNHERTGALEFSDRADTPPTHTHTETALDTLAEVVDRLDRGLPVDARSLLIIRHGPSLGGRRPKLTLIHEGRLWIAKFVSVRDLDELQPRREAFGLMLARAAGIEVPDFQLTEACGKPVLLVQRFDRDREHARHHLLSARSLQNLSERQLLSSASYPAVARVLRRLSDNDAAAAQWFDRMVFNILLGNTDDHALNHLFGWNGRELHLMPAFDLEQQTDTGPLRSQEMIVGHEGKRASYRNAHSAAAEFGLRPTAAQSRIDGVIERCRLACDDALLECGLEGAAADSMRKTLLLNTD